MSFTIYSQENNMDYVIDFITTKQGLSHNFVSSIVSDDLNIKWIGTENGITKFNGYDFEYIKPSKAYKELLNENIEVLYKDRDNNLWIGTKSGGLSYLDIKNNTIKNFNHLIDLDNEGDLRITALSQDRNGNIWIGTWSHGIFAIDYLNEKLLNQYKLNQPIHSITVDFKGNIWFADGAKLFKYNLADESISEYIFKHYITDILSDAKRQKIWIVLATRYSKLYNYNYKTNSIDSLETGVTSGFTKKLSLDKDGRIWIGTWGNGVYRSNVELSKFDRIRLVSRNSERISANYNTILNIHHDKNNITWLATANGGLARLVEGNGFKNANLLITNPELMGLLNVTNIYKDEDNLFLGTVFSGVYYGKDFSSLKQIKEIGNVRIQSFYENNNKLYIGGANSYYIFDLKLKKIIFSADFIKKPTSFYLDSDNNLFIGTQQNGLAIVNVDSIGNKDAYIFYSENLKSNRKLESDRITGIQEDENKNIWVSTYNGLHLYDKKWNVFKHQSELFKDKLPSVIINSMTLKNTKGYDGIGILLCLIPI